MMMQAAPIPPALSEPYEAFVKEPVQQPPEVKPADEDTQPQVEPENVLHDLTSVGRLCITKRLQVKSVLFLRGKKNRFLVRTQENNLIYTIQEQNSWWVGYFCYGLRPLQLHVRDGTGAEVMRIYRPYACTSRIFPCQLQRIQIFSPPGTRIGCIEQKWTPIRPEYFVKNENGEQVFWIKGPRVTISFFRDIQFHIYRTDGTAVGSTCKRWQGILHAMFFAPVSDKFGIAFERDLSVEEKALLLAATLLLDYMYYDV
ncbi:phospholipid scramblase 2-like [Pararge aegeria]|uniref:phospholipid scramblase 2-like n=1 Tax=Pararge aegeria TaxID=116150 RepID=UPI0019CFD8D0|nr:phospholipid scramblase 2-like [Pararge aegeria]